ncbi:DinB family protein [Heyndrickxia sp. NPDC080065]|uniref:DinB family protein n=1 Tax=Heyndrickxia sp. NPDC080065 TaxID=3390568 RepID=UPI003D0881E3
MQNRPESGEYFPYYSTYINLVPDEDILQILNDQMNKTITLLEDISDTQAHFKYAPGKWSVKEVLGHIADTERIMGYRLLCISRGETISLPGYDDKAYVERAKFERQSIQALLENLKIVRQSTIHLLKSLDEDAWLQRGTANDSEVTVRALAYIIAGHELHHLQIIKERYFRSENYPTK